MTVQLEPRRQIEAALRTYCSAFDQARFDDFAALFRRGRWFMVTEPGPAPVLDWISRRVILYDGRPLTRHETSGLVVTADGGDEAWFGCHLTIHQQLPGEDDLLLTHARFRGTFRRENGRWWWHEHAMDVEHAGDLSRHVRGGLATVVGD